MIRAKILGSLLAGLAFASVTLAFNEPAPKGSAAKVKATATATKIDDTGTQTVTITLDVAAGWHLYANPTNHNKDFLNAAATKVTIGAKVKPAKVSVKYPEGKSIKDKQDEYDTYEGKLKIQAVVTRATGDSSPLEITIAVQACDKSVCLEPAKVKLMVP